MMDLVGGIWSAGYSGSSGPRHSSQIAIGEGWYRAPHAVQWSGKTRVVGVSTGGAKCSRGGEMTPGMGCFLPACSPESLNAPEEKRPVPKRHAGREAF